MTSKNDDGQIVRYIEGSAWGICPSGKTIFLGKEDVIRELINSSKKKATDPMIRDIIKLERELQGKVAHEEKKELIKLEKEKKERQKKAVAMGIPLAKKRKGRKSKK